MSMGIPAFITLIVLVYSCQAMSPTPRPGHEPVDRSFPINRYTEKWPTHTITYNFDESLDQDTQAEVEKAMEYIMDKTCMEFVEEEDPESADVLISEDLWCYSAVGKLKRSQNMIALTDGCKELPNIFQMLLNTLGLQLEHIRSDRDDYITILWENIASGTERNFQKRKPEQNLLINDFDYDSIMLNGETWFSKDGTSPTMQATQEGVELRDIQDKIYPSESDIYRINTYYEC